MNSTTSNLRLFLLTTTKKRRPSRFRSSPAFQLLAQQTSSSSSLSYRTFTSSSSSSSSQQQPHQEEGGDPYNNNNYKVAIVGSGPAGCYTAKYLRSSLAKLGLATNIDIIDRLPTIGGLVRYGVAPDHPEVKNVLSDFESLFITTTTTASTKNEKNNKEDQNKDDGGGSISFYGNVCVGSNYLSIQELRQMYDAVVLACGCESDRKLNIPNEEQLQNGGVLSAREFVAWYNGHPDYVHIGEKVANAIGSSNKDGDDEDAIRQASVVVIGQGNVALDCARILAKGKTGLYDTDIASHALPVLGDGVSDISVVGRRGHIQGAFTIKEIRELVKLEEGGYGASLYVGSDELDLGTTDASKEELSGAGGRPKKRIEKLLREASENAHEVDVPKKVHLRFLLSPIRFEPDESDPSKLGNVVCERTRLEGEPGSQKAVGTGELHNFPAQLALVSIGYRGILIPGLEQWFDENRGTLRNENGRIEAPTTDLGGLYTSGWLKRGPSGIIGTNIPDAKDTVATIVKDLENYEGNRAKEGNTSLKELLASKDAVVVDWEGYRRIDQREKADKRSEAQPREKITSIQMQLEAASTN